MAKSGLIAASLGAGLLSLVAVAGEHPAPPADAESRAATALAAEVEEMVARSKPDSWEMRRACLYYALAGQHLLARHGISATLRVGETIRIKGASTDVTFVVNSMQVDRNPVESADAGAEVGIKISERARAGDAVLRITED